MIMTILKSLTLVAALLAGGISLAMAQNGLPTGNNRPAHHRVTHVHSAIYNMHHQIPGDESFADALNDVNCRVQLAALRDAALVPKARFRADDSTLFVAIFSVLRN
jgi:hypothetical protein